MQTRIIKITECKKCPHMSHLMKAGTGYCHLVERELQHIDDIPDWCHMEVYLRYIGDKKACLQKVAKLEGWLKYLWDNNIEWKIETSNEIADYIKDNNI